MSTRILIVDDSAFMRRVIKDILMKDNDLEVIGHARNGKDALEKLADLKPDVITLDVEMPIMDGIETLKQIINLYPNIPVVMLSGLTQLGADMTMKALEIGAVDFIEKPKSIFNMDADDKKEEIIQKVKVASKVKLNVQKKIVKILNTPKKHIKLAGNYNQNSTFSNLVSIGTSTGGPRALQSIIPNIPQEINASIVVVQHMPREFTKSLANRLNSMSQINVKEAEDGEILEKGYCYIAPGDYHMTVIERSGGKLHIKLNHEEKVSGHRPSVDVMMDSVSKISGYKKLGIILTGMGGDGAKGIKKIRENKGFTIAQDEESCVVFGMPKVAINKGAIDKVLPLDKIVYEIITNVEV